MTAAIADVAGLSFFSAAEPCTRDRFLALSAGEARWLVAAVTFDEDDEAGRVTCRIPETLAVALFDAFNGRDPLDPPPLSAELFDLVGEFANMACGAWLTRMVADEAFVLGRPTVTRADPGATCFIDEQVVLLTVNDLPLAVSMAPGRASAGAPPVSVER